MNATSPKDIFDVISPEEQGDIFQDIEQEDTSIDRIKEELLATLEKFDAKERKKEKRELTDELKTFIEQEIAQIKPKQNVIEKTVVRDRPVAFHVEPKIVEAPPQIIRETRIEVQKEKSDPRIDSLEKQIAELKKELAKTREIAEDPIVIHGGGPGVIGIPAPEPNPVGYVLTVNSDKKAQWKVATGGGASISGYTVTNGNTLKAFDVTNTSLDEIARVLGTLITEMQP